ncbi:MAG: serine/threonine-protein kinase [Phycisphaerae bacterium]|jgi:serine/threonine protein kinase/tetratricopeptide (TPR) repeat protein
MNAALQRKVEELFHEAAVLPPDERPAFLDAACDESDVRAEVDSLLAHLDSHTIASLHAVEELDRSDNELIGQSIGPYKLLELLGEGGFGAVYMAQQERPVRRTVALKIVKLGMDTRQVIARFEAERQALAMMEHPHIASVLDAGATEGGRPYFVMELVRGAPITEYCDEHWATIRERAALFVQVCQAVHHAHQKGVIHRDIKPSNVLVTLRDGVPAPKVIDFGIAKAMHESLTEKTLQTGFRQFVGTPEYVSPEQVSMGELDVDTRSDIYSLGVLLYELLAGVTPFDTQALRDTSYAEMQRVVREREPPTPSRRVGGLGDTLARVARARRIEPGSLARTLRGDLDWIVMKALEKDRDRRYDAAVALSEDVQRYLRDEPVTAGPPGLTYQLRKLAKRHKAAFASAAVVLGILLAFGIWMSVLYAQADVLRAHAQHERQTAEANTVRAQKAERLAQAEAQTAAEVAQILTALLEAADPLQTDGSGGTAREMLDAAAENIQRNLKEQPEIQARLLDIVGRVYTNLGLFGKAQPLLATAVDLRRATLGDAHADTIASMNSLGKALMYDSKLSEAEPLLREAMSLGQQALGPDHAHTVNAMAYLAWTLQSGGRWQAAEPYCRQALDSFRRLYGDEHPKTLVALNALSWLLQRLDHLDEARALSEEALRTSMRVYGEESVYTAESMHILGVLHLHEQRTAEAMPLITKAVEVRRRLLGRDHPETLESMENVAWALAAEGHWSDAEQIYRDALAGLERLHGRNHRYTCRCMAGLARPLATLGKTAEAEKLLHEALPVLRRELGDLHEDSLECMYLLLNVLWQQGRMGEQEEMIRQVLAAHRQAYGDSDVQLIGPTVALARCRQQQGHAPEAAALFQQAIDIAERQQADGQKGPCPGCLMSLRGEYLLAQERFDEAERMFLDALPAIQARHGKTSDTTLRAIRRIAAFYETWGKPADATEWRDRLPGEAQ